LEAVPDGTSASASTDQVVPEGHRGRRADGLIIGLQVPDATEVDARLRAAGVRVVLPLRDEPFGQRHVIVADPNDVLVDIVQAIPADPNWLAQHGLLPGAAAADATAPG
jgi:catechol 2,3-dioxygenase-like lactoylglutathione lyase family enzyme